jgi:hypothetical protein
MATKRGRPKTKALSKGQRTHVRRVKQEARRAGTPYRPPFQYVRPAATPRDDEKKE